MIEQIEVHLFLNLYKHVFDNTEIVGIFKNWKIKLRSKWHELVGRNALFIFPEDDKKCLLPIAKTPVTPIELIHQVQSRKQKADIFLNFISNREKKNFVLKFFSKF